MPFDLNFRFRKSKFSAALAVFGLFVILVLVGALWLYLIGWTALRFDRHPAANRGASDIPAGSSSIVRQNSDSNAVPAQFRDESVFLSAIKQNQLQPLPAQINGIVVPHHLLAQDLIARIFWRASRQKYKRVILFSPDHFYLGKTPISYATADFETVFGKLILDRDFTAKLGSVPNASSANFFYREHGIGAELPFIKYFFPDAKIVVMDLSINSKPADFQGLIDFIKANVDSETLLVQSTDFSHYLNAAQAAKKDRQTISLLNKIDQGANPEILFTLNQPDNIDCIACQYVQSKIQKEVYGAGVHFFDHKNSQDYTPQPVTQTTSYIPQIYFK